MREEESCLQDWGDFHTPMVRTRTGLYWEHVQDKWNNCLRWDFLNILRGVSTPMRMGQEQRALLWLLATQALGTD